MCRKKAESAMTLLFIKLISFFTPKLLSSQTALPDSWNHWVRVKYMPKVKDQTKDVSLE